MRMYQIKNIPFCGFELQNVIEFLKLVVFHWIFVFLNYDWNFGL